MELSARHKDILSELIGIGYGRAGASLSKLVGERIVLEPPKVEVRSIEEVGDALAEVLRGEVTTVHQVFSGAVSGHGLLLIEYEAAELLTAMVIGGDVLAVEKRAAVREAMGEIGNIILQAALGACGDILQIHLRFLVPRLAVESVEDLLRSVVLEKQELQFALMIKARFKVHGTQVTGYVVLVFGVTSFSRLIDAIDAWAQQSGWSPN